MERLKIYEALLNKWNPAINLVAKSTLADAWQRHIVDSAQIYALADDGAGHWADLGSGGGFPGMVIAILAAEKLTPKWVSLVESDTRKCTFLRTVARETGIDVTIVNARIEDSPPLQADVLSARALADLTTLLSFCDQHLSASGQALFLKGASWQKELEEAQRSWRFEHQVVTRKTDDGPAILRISGVSRV
ncbi:MAG: 16S rRNA (guanine(527)-N(7))-methyltransferase RsmG [Pseudomonadota bacterium]